MNEVFIALLGVFVGAGLEWFRESRQSRREDRQELERWARDNQREVIWRAQETLISAQQYVASSYIDGSASVRDAKGNALIVALEAYAQRVDDQHLADLLRGYSTYLQRFVLAERLSESEWGSMVSLTAEFHRRVAAILQGGD